MGVVERDYTMSNVQPEYFVRLVSRSLLRGEVQPHTLGLKMGGMTPLISRLQWTLAYHGLEFQCT